MTDHQFDVVVGNAIKNSIETGIHPITILGLLSMHRANVENYWQEKQSTLQAQKKNGGGIVPCDASGQPKRN